MNEPAGVDVADRYRGCLLGLAVGDALGTTLEFRAPGSFPPLTDLVGGGPFGLRAGQWTDDTSMAIGLAESLLDSGGCDARDQMRRYVRWWREGYRSSTGVCFDIGTTVAGALRRFEDDEKTRGGQSDPFQGSTDPRTAGNGSLMRLAPVPLFFAGAGPREAMARAAESSRPTHAAPAAVDGCRYLTALILGALGGASKEELLSPFFTPAGAEDIWREEPPPGKKAEGICTFRNPFIQSYGARADSGSERVVCPELPYLLTTAVSINVVTPVSPRRRKLP